MSEEEKEKEKEVEVSNFAVQEPVPTPYIGKVHKSIPIKYRLARTFTGELMLQGYFFWVEHLGGNGYEWQDILTVELDPEPQLQDSLGDAYEGI